MRSFCIKLFFFQIVLLVQIGRSQVGVFLPSFEEADSLIENNEVLKKPITDPYVFIFRNLLYTNYSGFADFLKNENDYQVYEFFQFGRPRFIAPLNMLPHQAVIFKNYSYLNQPANGLFNTRLLSAEQSVSLYRGSDKYASSQNSYTLQPVEISNEQPFTRLKFYEGDERFSDLDIFFTRDITNTIQLKLAGFTRGYPGSDKRANNVMYDTQLKLKLNDKTTALLSWERNHDRTTLIAEETPAVTFINGTDVTRTGIRFIFEDDTIAANKAEIGLISVANRHVNYWFNTFKSTQKSDDYRLYFSKDVTVAQHNFSGTFSINNNFIRGNSFRQKSSNALFSLNMFDRWHYSHETFYEFSAQIESLSEYDPVINGSVSWNHSVASNLFSRAEVSYYNRFANSVESATQYDVFTGNNNLTAEKHMEISFLQRWQLYDFLFLQGKAGMHKVQDEISFTHNTFTNAADRNWSFLSAESRLKLWNLIFSGGGRLLKAKDYISPKQNLWGGILYHGPLFGGTIFLNASANIRWHSGQQQVLYDPYINRFYSGSEMTPAYTTAGIKIAGTVSDAEIFFEMDNLFSAKPEQVSGYYAWQARQVRFGVNWILWD